MWRLSSILYLPDMVHQKCNPVDPYGSTAVIFGSYADHDLSFLLTISIWSVHYLHHRPYLSKSVLYPHPPYSARRYLKVGGGAQLVFKMISILHIKHPPAENTQVSKHHSLPDPVPPPLPPQIDLSLLVSSPPGEFQEPSQQLWVPDAIQIRGKYLPTTLLTQSYFVWRKKIIRWEAVTQTCLPLVTTSGEYMPHTLCSKTLAALPPFVPHTDQVLACMTATRDADYSLTSSSEAPFSAS
ncbi:uncharacterized protein F5891DRAFT_462033 [Suillus fuscotomentosus]|uniref:Uncharacterized protein n=1 Tax=Suillus fuscotomentosus TaxID=1912939 RepID=A0AAD4E2G2_9AGAM|nr:uncharacterized protein F5891DRAFT_462033 [Suillus fuscotomentosus]KAG1898495.1 hypothetical protein F5891DRAFT_462033 [Suillus fuscotomentosus]